MSKDVKKAVKKTAKKKGGKYVRKGKGKSKSRAKGSKARKGVRRSRSKSRARKGSKATGTKTTAKAGSVNSPQAPPPPPPPPEIVSKNKALLDKVTILMEGLKADLVTRNTKDDLDKVQALVKNIQFRDNGEYGRVREVQFTDRQKALIKMIGGLEIDSHDQLMMTITKDSGKSIGGKTNSATPSSVQPKIDFPYEKLEFVATKAK